MTRNRKGTAMQPFKLDYRPFPANCSGTVYGITCYHGGHYLILIDSAAPAEQQAATLRHELAHIVLNHFTGTARSIEQLEAEAESYAAQMAESEFDALMQWAI